MTSPAPAIRLQAVTEADVTRLMTLITALAEYERLSHELVATEEGLRDALFGPSRRVEAVLAYVGEEPVGYALWFHNFSTFLGRLGLYLEDLFVLPAWRGRGIGRTLLVHLAKVAVERGCGRMEWVVLDWNETGIGFYKRLGAQPMDGWTLFRLTGDALDALAQES